MAIDYSSTEPNDGDAYDVVRARGQDIHVDRGETLENKLIDLSTGNRIGLHVTGADTVIRNVGFTGCYRGDEFLISIDAGPGAVRFENVYMGDGATRDEAESVHGPGAVFLRAGNEADVTFRHCNVQGFPNNGFHCSNTGAGSGSVHFESCFGKNNGVATFRCGGGNDLIENCVAYTDGTNYCDDGDREYLETNGRPVWIWNGGTVTITDSQFADGRYPHAVVAGANDSPGSVRFESGAYRGSIQRATGSTVDVGADVSNDPELSIPAGVPTTAEAAASGAPLWPSSPATTDDTGQFPHAIVFDGSDVAEPSTYSFEATGAVAVAHDDEPITHDDIVHEQPISGFVDEAVDAYWFQGTIEVLSFRGAATVDVRYDCREETNGGSAGKW